MPRFLNATIFFSFILARFASGQCPSGCNCMSTTVICNGLTGAGFPEFPPANASVIETLYIVGANIPVLNVSTLENFISLRSLQIWSVGLEVIEPGVFEPLQNQHISINIQFNNLREILPGTFNGSQVSFRTINLQNNMIEVVHPGAFDGVVHRGFIDLRFNVLARVREGSLVTSYSSVILGTNLDCDCNLRWLPHYLNTTTTTLTGSCASPPSRMGMQLDSLTEDMLLCPCVGGCVEGSCDETVGLCDCSEGWEGDNCSEPCAAGTYGVNCMLNCTCVHSNRSCHHVNGTCYCEPGYTGDDCEQRCSGRMFGQDCSGLCQCRNNATCDPVTGSCACPAGWRGTYCNTSCSEGFYGRGCLEECVCGIGSCDPVDGRCVCPVGYLGADCSHNCAEAMDCGRLNRHPCSLNTPENTCGNCLMEYRGTSGVGNDVCTFCPQRLNCGALNRESCSMENNTCGPCYNMFVTASGENVNTPANESCFDPCKDGIMNYNETGVDCGGPWCGECTSSLQTCQMTSDCGSSDRVCVKEYVLPSEIPYDYDVDQKLTCVNISSLAEAVLNRFRDAFQERFALSSSSGMEENHVFIGMLKEEIRAQFNFNERELCDYLEVGATEVEEGKFHYNIYMAFDDSSLNTQDYVSASDKVIANIHQGQLRATTVFSQKNQYIRFNF